MTKSTVIMVWLHFTFALTTNFEKLTIKFEWKTYYMEWLFSRSVYLDPFLRNLCSHSIIKT